MSATVSQTEKELKSVTMNCMFDGPKGVPTKVSESLVAEEDMHIVAIEHFNGVLGGDFSDNGHLLSKNPDNPWLKWEAQATKMEPTGTKGYFGYCGRDYYSEVAGIGDVMAYETFPAGCHFLVRKGETLYLHCYGCSYAGREKTDFHHAVRLIYW